MSAPARRHDDPQQAHRRQHEPPPKAPMLGRACAEAMGYTTIDEADYEEMLALDVEPRDMPLVANLL